MRPAALNARHATVASYRYISSALLHNKPGIVSSILFRRSYDLLLFGDVQQQFSVFLVSARGASWLEANHIASLLQLKPGFRRDGWL